MLVEYCLILICIVLWRLLLGWLANQCPTLGGSGSVIDPVIGGEQKLCE